MMDNENGYKQVKTVMTNPSLQGKTIELNFNTTQSQRAQPESALSQRKLEPLMLPNIKRSQPNIQRS